MLRLHAVLRKSMQSFRLEPPSHETSAGQLGGPAERKREQSSGGVQDSPPATFENSPLLAAGNARGERGSRYVYCATGLSEY
jgi:hypothetical protein